jgi:hypothetical protein
MKSRILVFLIISGFVLAGAMSSSVAAEPEPGVARVGLIHGDVSSMRGDSGDWVALTVNAPLVQGDRVSTGDQSRTEIDLDYANILRLGENTEARIADLTEGRMQVQLSNGILNLTVLKGSESNIEVDTPNVAVRPSRDGVYRIQVNSNGETEVIVRRGEAEVFTQQGSVRADKNDMVMVRGVDQPEYQLTKAPGRDSWDEWNEQRDAAINDAHSWTYASRYYTGAYDLDRYGHWVTVPDYGYVWTPYVGVSWAPYQAGRWVWEPYWGWTWVSYEPWGWAPYHYGRWFCYANSWYWWPGPSPLHYRPVWAPAYVSFFGFGAGRFSFSFGVGWGYSSIGWLPVGPSDYYYPWYGGHNRYRSYDVRNINVHNVTNIYNIYNDPNGRAVRPLGGHGRPYGSNVGTALENPRMRSSMAVLRTDDFVGGRTGNYGRVNDRELRSGQILAGTPPVVPTRASLRVSDRTVAPSRAATARDTQFTRMYSRREPPRINNSFDQRAAALRSMVETTQPVSVERSRGGSSSTVGRPNAGVSGTTRVPTNREASEAFNGSANSGTAHSQTGESKGGWTRFGTPRNQAEHGATGNSAPTRGTIQNRELRQAPANNGSSSAPANGREQNTSRERRTPQVITVPNSNTNSNSNSNSRNAKENWQRFRGNASRGSGSSAPPETQKAPETVSPAKPKESTRSPRSESSAQFFTIPRSNSHSGSNEARVEQRQARTYQQAPENSSGPSVTTIPSRSNESAPRYRQNQSSEYYNARSNGGYSGSSGGNTGQPRYYQRRSEGSSAPAYQTTPNYDRSGGAQRYETQRYSRPSYTPSRTYTAPSGSRSSGSSAGSADRGSRRRDRNR